MVNGDDMVGGEVSDAMLIDPSISGGTLQMKYVTAEVGVFGSYENIKRFMGDIADSMRDVEITSASISTSSEESDNQQDEEGGGETIPSDVLDASISLRFAYAFPPLASPRGILDAFAVRSADVFVGVSENMGNLDQGEGVVGATEYTYEGRLNPFLP
jgi:hypothetical protein